jgi:hypothetical protein
MNKLCFLPFFLIACIQGTASDTITKTTTLDIPIPSIPMGVLPSGFQVPPTKVDQTEPVDISSTISDIQKIGVPAMTITQNHVHSNTGDFSFFQEIEITATPDGGSPTTVADMILTPAQQMSADLDIPVLVSGDQLLTMFEAGNVTLDFVLTCAGTPPSSDAVALISTIGMDVSLSVSKNIGDIGSSSK